MSKGWLPKINKRHTLRPKRCTWATALFITMWRTGYAGIRVGEAENLGRGRRGRKGYNKRAVPHETTKDHIWIRSHNVGSIRTDDRIDIFALQEANADIKTMHDAKQELSKKQLRPYGVKLWRRAS